MPRAPARCAGGAPEVVDITLSFDSPRGRGSGLLSWRTTTEIALAGFNVVTRTPQGERIQLNSALIRCTECATGIGARHSFILAKQKSGRNLFIEMLQTDGLSGTFGPAHKIP